MNNIKIFSLVIILNWGEVFCTPSAPTKKNVS